MNRINNIIEESTTEEVTEVYDYFTEQDEENLIVCQVKDFA